MHRGPACAKCLTVLEGKHADTKRSNHWVSMSIGHFEVDVRFAWYVCTQHHLDLILVRVQLLAGS